METISRLNRLFSMPRAKRVAVVFVAVVVALAWAVWIFLGVELGALFRRPVACPACKGTGDAGGNVIGCPYCGGERC